MITAEEQKKLAIELHKETWSLIDKETRTEDENIAMIHTAHACQYHWTQVGKPVNIQRGEWLLSKVYWLLSMGESALVHAERCWLLTNQYEFQLNTEAGFVDFDLAYANEIVYHAKKLNNHTDAHLYFEEAENLGKRIADEEDRNWFFGDLEYGLNKFKPGYVAHT